MNRNDGRLYIPAVRRAIALSMERQRITEGPLSAYLVKADGFSPEDSVSAGGWSLAGNKEEAKKMCIRDRLNSYGQPCNYDGQAVEAKPTTGKTDEYGRPYYYVLNPDGGHISDAAGNVTMSVFGPLSTLTRSDNYGNQGYYILPNLAEGSYKLRFTMPESYNEYGLTTWEIGLGEDKIPMAVTEPGEMRPDNRGEAKTLTFTTERCV